MRPHLLADYATALPELGQPWQPVLPEPPAEGPGPALVVANDELAADLGIDREWLHGDEALAVLGARATLPGTTPVAQAYAGHQFGSFSPVLGDGRAVLLGELRDRHGRLRDVALKGSGRTPFSRRGDGRAVLGPVLREYQLGEAMHAHGVPTTRALAAVTTGDLVLRDGGPTPGAVLTRVSASHLRVGTFEVVAHSMPGPIGRALLPQLLSYAVTRHHPESAQDEHGSALGLLDAVVQTQARLVAHWVSLGFVHGVMNTDNTTISGETIDYGPCAWLEHYDENAVFSSIDSGGRYRFGNQPTIMLWNLSRFAESLLTMVESQVSSAATGYAETGKESAAGPAVAAATEVLQTFESRYRQAWLTRMRAKLGLPGEQPDDADLVGQLLAWMHAERLDYTRTWRELAAYLRVGDPAGSPAAAGVPQPWRQRWQQRLGAADPRGVADAMDRVNPLYLPRNHLVESALGAAVAGDLALFDRLLGALCQPFTERPDQADLAQPAPPGFTEHHVTFCGT